MKKDGRLDFGHRAREKQAARDADERDLASGRRSALEIDQANSIFSAFGFDALRNAKIHPPEKR